MALFIQEILRGGGGQRDYHRLRTCVKLHIEQAQRSKNCRIQSELTERAAVTKGKGQNSFTKRKTGECFQWVNRETSAEEVKNTGESSLKPAVKTDDKRSTSLEARPATGAKIVFLWEARCKRSSCNSWHPPVCRNFKSGNRCIHGNNCLYRHADGEEKPSKRSKSESTQGPVVILKEKKVQGCESQNSDAKKSILRKAGQNEIERFGGTRCKILRTHLVRYSKFGKEKGHLEALSKKVNLMSEILARRSLRKEHRRKPHDKKSAPAKQHGIWREK